MNFPVPDYSAFMPITANLNHLYNKESITVYPAGPAQQDSMGSQFQTLGDPYTVVCNVQFKEVDEHTEETEFKSSRNRRGRVYTAEIGRLKYGDEFVHDGERYRVTGIETFRDNLTFADHHVEADFVQIEGSTPRV